MSEVKKIEELLTGMSKDLQELKKWKNEQSQSTEQHTSSKPHTHSANVEFDCPDCQKEYNASVIEKAKPQILKEQREKIKSMSNVELCENCGEIYDGEESEDCPTCHGHSEE